MYSETENTLKAEIYQKLHNLEKTMKRDIEDQWSYLKSLREEMNRLLGGKNNETGRVRLEKEIN